MADQSDPIELDRKAAQAEEIAKDHQQTIEDMRELVGQYAEVKDLVLQPGWPILIRALEKKADHYRKISLELLELILIKNDGANNAEFTDARVHCRALDEAIMILLEMRVKAREAQEFLDKVGNEGLDSPQKG